MNFYNATSRLHLSGFVKPDNQRTDAQKISWLFFYSAVADLDRKIWSGKKNSERLLISVRRREDYSLAEAVA